MAQIEQDRIVRKEVALGVVREIPPPTSHIGQTLCPDLDVESDDVIFAYVMPDTDGLAPARAEDSEAELAQKDDSVGTGRASIIDWAIKDHFDPSDVSRYREFARLAELAAQGGGIGAFLGRMAQDLPGKIAEAQLRRRRKLDNRREWLVMTSLETGKIAYNDGKIKFSVDYGRPADQQDVVPTSAASYVLANAATMDPISDLEAIKELMDTRYSVSITRGITSKKVLRSFRISDKFKARMFYSSGDPRYLPQGLNGGPVDEQAAINMIEAATGIRFTVYDSVYRTRAYGSKTVVNNRFTNDNKIIFLPSEEDISEIDDTAIGFGKVASSPHPEGGWTSGFYEWEKDTGPDPWGHDFGTGKKMFPIWPYMEYTYVMKPL